MEVTLTVVLAVKVTLHVVPEQPDIDQAIFAPDACVAVSFTLVPTSKLAVALHVPEQEMPEGVELILVVWVPSPWKLTVSDIVARLNTALTVVDALKVTEHVLAEPVQPPPLHPAKTELRPGAAVSVTTGSVVVREYLFVQAVGQVMVLVESVTVPLPVPDSVTVSWTWSSADPDKAAVNASGLTCRVADLVP